MDHSETRRGYLNLPHQYGQQPPGPRRPYAPQTPAPRVMTATEVYHAQLQGFHNIVQAAIAPIAQQLHENFAVKDNELKERLQNTQVCLESVLNEVKDTLESGQSSLQSQLSMFRGERQEVDEEHQQAHHCLLSAVENVRREHTQYAQLQEEQQCIERELCKQNNALSNIQNYYRATQKQFDNLLQFVPKTDQNEQNENKNKQLEEMVIAVAKNQERILELLSPPRDENKRKTRSSSRNESDSLKELPVYLQPVAGTLMDMLKTELAKESRDAVIAGRSDKTKRGKSTQREGRRRKLRRRS